jgi:hypothetical protein
MMGYKAEGELHILSLAVKFKFATLRKQNNNP